MRSKFVKYEEQGDHCLRGEAAEWLLDRVATLASSQGSKPVLSRSVAVARFESKLIDRISKRAQSQLGLIEDHAYHTQLLRYGEGGAYSNHTDCGARENERVVTTLTYLNDDMAGGATTFPQLGLEIKPVKGMLLVFSSADSNGKCDPRTGTGRSLAVRCRCHVYCCIRRDTQSGVRNGD